MVRAGTVSQIRVALDLRESVVRSILKELGDIFE